MARSASDCKRDSAPGRKSEALVNDIRIKFQLKPRAAKVLKAMLTTGPDFWHYRGSEGELAATVGVARKTAGRGVKDLEAAGLLAVHHRNGCPKKYRVRKEVIEGEVSFFDVVAQKSLLQSEPVDQPPQRGSS